MKHSGNSLISQSRSLDSICGEHLGEKNRAHYSLWSNARWLWFKLWSVVSKKCTSAEMVCGECSCSRRRESSYFLFTSVSGRGGMPWVRAKGKNEACGRVSRDDLRGDACPMVSGHNKALACSANTHWKNIIYYYESGIEIEFPQQSRLMRHPPPHWQ